MNGHWQKEIPKNDGTYWTATRSGELNRPLNVVWDGDQLIYAGGTPQRGEPGNFLNHDSTWKGWWWSEPLENPPEPPAWDGPFKLVVRGNGG